jgi:EAL domain-containing protein (putative c-di-GMP-specific phosphodiesterase class I)
MLLPAQFIAVAEETGQIIPIGSWVLRQAMTDLAEWRERPPCGEREQTAAVRGDLYVSVNVSARQFADADFAGLVRRVLDSSGLDPAALMLELTETALLASDDRVLADLAGLRETGVRLAIDDFGTGYSTLSYLAELPVDVVKMDRSFVERIAAPGAEQRLALATGIVQMAVTLGHQVIAEGIETEAQRDLLVAMGCPYGQGYLLAMPMNPDQAWEIACSGFPAPAPPRAH